MEKSFLERYQAGEHQAVYQDLVALGPAVHDPQYYADACAVAEAMMQRVRHNSMLLVERLRSLNYRFACEQDYKPEPFDVTKSIANMRAQMPPTLDMPLPEQFWQLLERFTIKTHEQIDTAMEQLKAELQAGQSADQAQPAPPWQPYMPPQQSDIELLDQAAERFGPIPPTVLALYRFVGSLNLCGDHPKLSHYYDHTQGFVSDPLCFGIDPTDIEVYDDEREDMQDQYEQGDESMAEELARPFMLSLSPDMSHKSNYSGGGPNGFELPQHGFDALISSDHWRDTMLIPYLRECFAWGGFPEFRHNPEAATTAAEELAFLTKDLLEF